MFLKPYAELEIALITIKTKEEIEILREGGRRLAEILGKVADAAKSGVSTYDLDRLAQSLIFESGGEPSFKGYKQVLSDRPYPATLCVSINEEVVHSIPRKDKILKEGDIVGLDIGMWWPAATTTNYQQLTTNINKLGVGGWERGVALATDMAVTIGIGKISKDAERLILGTKEALGCGIKAVRAGATVSDIGYAIEKHLKKYNLGIVRDLAGHGVGYKIHEEPLIPNYGKPGEGIRLKEGMVIAIEPISTLGGHKIFLADDKWTFKTSDGSLSAHFEHTMAVTENDPDVLTKN